MKTKAIDARTWRIGQSGLLSALVWMTLAGAGPAAAQNAETTPADFEVEGVRLTGVTAGADDARHAVLLLHDWFGITPATHEAAARLGSLGYRVLALDLYEGRGATDAAGAQALMGSLVPAEVEGKVERAVRYLAADGRPVATLGFSLGGLPALTAAFLEPERVRAAVTVYAGGLQGVFEPRGGTLPTPLLLVTGADDAAPMASLRALLDPERELGHTLDALVIPDARHGYAQALYAGGANLDPEATARTWERVERFLELHLRGGS